MRKARTRRFEREVRLTVVDKLRRAKVTDVSRRTPLNKTSTLAFPRQGRGALAPLIEASADESERSRRLAMPVVEAMSRAGLSRLWVPRSLGGQRPILPPSSR